MTFAIQRPSPMIPLRTGTSHESTLVLCTWKPHCRTAPSPEKYAPNQVATAIEAAPSGSQIAIVRASRDRSSDATNTPKLMTG
jgi:hypothetical protein